MADLFNKLKCYCEQAYPLTDDCGWKYICTSFSKELSKRLHGMNPSLCIIDMSLYADMMAHKYTMVNKCFRYELGMQLVLVTQIMQTFIDIGHDLFIMETINGADNNTMVAVVNGFND